MALAQRPHSSVLLVSKPVEPPWNDSSKNLVRDLARELRHPEAVTLVRRSRADGSQRDHHGRALAIYPPQGVDFAPSLFDQAAVLAALAVSRANVWHFFFAPNRRTSAVARAASAVRRKPTVHTVCSAPRFEQRPDLFADITAVLSEHTYRRFRSQGIGAEKLRRVAPCVPHLDPIGVERRRQMRRHLEVPDDAPLAVYAGDLEVGGGAERSLAVLEHHPRAVVCIACRAKTPMARAREHKLRSAHDPERVRWVGETDEILTLLGSADLVLLPSDSLYAKMDYPLVVLEALALGRPALVCKNTPAEEIGPGAVAVPLEEAARRAAQLLASRERLEALGAAGRSHVREVYSAEIMARAYEAIYAELLPN